MKTLKFKKTLIVASVLCSGLLGYYATDKSFKSDNVIVSHYSNLFDVANKELLVGWADNVFVGTIEKKEKETKDTISPYSIYNVSVEENIKGELTNKVDISHRVAYDYDHDSLYKEEGDDYLIEGQRYIFVSRYDANSNTHAVVAVHGNIKIDSEEKKKDLVAKFKDAKKNQKDYKKLQQEVK